MADFYNKDKGGSFQEIIWDILKSLREKASEEFRSPQKKTTFHGNISEITIEKDSRKEFIQLVEFFSDIFVQEFDEDTKKEYDKIFEEIKKERDEINKTDEKLTDEKNEDFVVFKMDKTRELLRLIMSLIHKKKYLKGLGSFRREESTREEQED